MTRLISLSCLALGLCVFTGCSADDTLVPATARDAGSDIAVDGSDATTADSTVDSTVDSGVDSALDSSPDSSTEDSQPDSQSIDSASDSADANESDQNTPDAAPATLGKLSPQDLHTELDTKDFLLINVHIPYAGEIPKTDKHISYLDTAALKTYVGSDLDTKVVIYCLSNGMSIPAAQFLVDNGYRKIRYMDGGMSAWKSAGYTLNP